MLKSTVKVNIHQTYINNLIDQAKLYITLLFHKEI